MIFFISLRYHYFSNRARKNRHLVSAGSRFLFTTSGKWDQFTPRARSAQATRRPNVVPAKNVISIFCRGLFSLGVNNVNAEDTKTEDITAIPTFYLLLFYQHR